MERRKGFFISQTKYKSMLRLLLVFISVGIMQLTANAQDKITISGVVTESSGVSIIGATIVVSGTTIGTVTDYEGKYTLEVSKTDTALEFSYIGYLTEKVRLTGQAQIDMVLVEDIMSLGEVVVIGYGTIKKSDVTGSISSVTADSYKEQPVTNVTQALQGRTTGVTIVSNNGNPGKEAKIRIRGSNSLTGNNDPLLVVDGLAMNISLNDLNVNDIESMEILKDASATAVFGSRGANGVILITTKKGKSGTSQVQFSTNFGISNLANKLDKLDAPEFMELYNVYHNDHFSQDSIDHFTNNPGDATDWQDEIFNTGYTQDYQLSIRGGSEKINYYMSGGYQDISGIILNSSQKRYSVRSNISAKVNDRLSVDLNIFANHKEGEGNNENGSYGIAAPWGAVIYSPNFSPRESQINPVTGIYDWNIMDPLATGTRLNPLMLLHERHQATVSNAVVVNSSLNYKILPGLSYKLVLGADYSSTDAGNWSTTWGQGGNPTKASKAAYYGQTMQVSNILNYNKTFNSIHDIGLTAVHEALQSVRYDTKAFGTDVNPILVVEDNNLGVANIQSIESHKTQNSLLSYVGRANYSLMSKYLITATLRADGSSKFPNNKWGYFPSAAIGWRLSEEDFISQFSFISNLKLRAGWGITGNQNIPVNSSAASIGTMNHSYGQDQLFPGSKITGGESPGLKWETTEQVNVGVDFSVYDDRVSFGFDYYNKNTYDLLYYVTLPDYEGGGRVMKNIGDINNKGYEISLSGVAISTTDFNWKVDFNLSAFKNTVIKLGAEGDSMQFTNNYSAGTYSQSPVVIANGQSLGTYYLYDHIGIY